MCIKRTLDKQDVHLTVAAGTVSRRKGKDVGRSVTAWGFWADILNGPYHCFGTVCEVRCPPLCTLGLGLSF